MFCVLVNIRQDASRVTERESNSVKRFLDIHYITEIIYISCPGGKEGDLCSVVDKHAFKP